MSSLRVQGPWETQTSTAGNWLSDQASCSLSFFLRFNRAMTTGAVLSMAGGNILSVFIQSANTLSVNFWGQAGGGTDLQATIPFNVGQVNHLAIVLSPGSAHIYWDGTNVAGSSGLGTSWNANGVLQVGCDAANSDVQFSDLAIWNGYALSDADRSNLMNRVNTPANLGTAATAWWTLGGTADATALPASDAGFRDQIGGTVHFSAPTGTGSGVYSPDTLSISSQAAVLDAYVAEPGNLFFILAGRPSLGFQMVGNSGQNTYRVASIRPTAGGTSYTAPTATLTGGTPTRAAVLGTPIVVGGKIVGYPITDGGDGYLGTDTLAVVVTDSTGSGATSAITRGGMPMPITSVAATLAARPAVSVNGTPAVLGLIPYLAITGGGAYSAAPTATITDGTHSLTAATSITITAPATTGPVTGISQPVGLWQTDWGTPTVNFSGGVGSGATATVTVAPFWTDHSHDEPFACYQLQSAVVASDVITWGAPAGWASLAAGPLPVVTDGTPAANYSGVLEPTFRIPPTGLPMRVGANVASVPSANYSPVQVQADRCKNSFVQSGTAASDGSLASWTRANAGTIVACNVAGLFNAVDAFATGNPGFPFLDGPGLVAGGGGSGAVLIPVISGGAIASIFVASGGTAYPNSGTITISGGGGWAATATYTASGGVIQSASVSIGGGGYADGLWKLGYSDSAPDPGGTISAPTDLVSQSNEPGYNSEPRIVLLKYQTGAHAGLNGTILGVCNVAAVDGSGSGNALAKLTSSDGGVTWTVTPLLAPSGGNTPFQRSIAELSNGTILVGFDYDTNANIISGKVHEYVAKSTDGGATWSNLTTPANPVSVPWTYGTDIGVLFGAFVETTPGGDLLVPAYAVLVADSSLHAYLLRCPAGLDPSVGSNWVTQGTIAADLAHKYDETTILQTTDANHFVAISRDDSDLGLGDLYLTTFTSGVGTSSQFAVTSGPSRMHIPGTVGSTFNAVAPHLLKLADGKALLSWGVRYGTTWGVGCLISADGGLTWPDLDGVDQPSPALAMPYQQDSTGQAAARFGYPWAVQRGDGTILLLSFHQVGLTSANTTNVAAVRFDEAWVVRTATYASLVESSGNWNWYDLSTYTGLPPALAGLISPGSGGAGITKAYYGAWKGGSHPWGPGVNIQVTGGTVNSSGVHASGAGTSLVVAPPNISLAQAAGDTTPNPNMLSWLTFGGGKYAGVLRYMDGFDGFGGVDKNDAPEALPALAGTLIPPGAFSWQGLGTSAAADLLHPGRATITITGCRPYNRTSSPRVYFDTAYPGAAATGTTPPYAFTPPSTNWAAVDGTFSAVEFITTTPGIKTGHFPEVGDTNFLPTATPGPYHMLFQDGQSGGVAGPPVPLDLATGGTQTNAYVTSPTSFVFLAKKPGSGTGIPGATTVYCTQDVNARNSVNFLWTTAGGSGFTGASNPPVVDVAPPVGAWRTATAIGVISGGVLVSITPADHGNNYAYTPGVKVISSAASISSGGVLPTVTANAPVGGQITGYSIVGGGSGMDGFVGIQVDPPGITATASPTVTSGGVASIALSVPNNGGAGYTNGPPEVIITGAGTGAAAHAVLSGTTVASIVVDTPGTGYSQSNTSVALAPPPSQATAYVSGISGLSGNSLQVFRLGLQQFGTQQFGDLAVVSGGFGYSTTPPAVTISGGGGTGAAATAVLTYPCSAFTASPAPACIPREAAIAQVNALPGCAVWMNWPIFLTDDAAGTLAATVVSQLAAGHQCYAEVGNEPWNFSEPFGYCQVLGALQSPQVDSTAAYTLYAAAKHTVIAGHFASAGRAGDLVRVFGSFYENPATTQDIISTANAHAIRADAVAVAPYLNAPKSYADNGYDLASHIAASSCAPGIAYSRQYGTAWPWTMTMYHCWIRHHLAHSLIINGTGLYGQAAGLFAQHRAFLAAYTVPGLPVPELVAYEGGFELMVTFGIATAGTQADFRTNDAVLHYGLLHDFLFHPRMRETVATYHLVLARNGVTASCWYRLAGSFGPDGELWSILSHEGMQPGVGDGSDGRTTNLTWVSTGQGQYHNNVSPALAGFQLAGGAAPTTTTPTITWSNPPDITVGTVLSGTQLNATASVPGTFAYTPPAGTMLAAGTNQALSVVFTPTDTANYTTASATVRINVAGTTPANKRRRWLPPRGSLRTRTSRT